MYVYCWGNAYKHDCTLAKNPSQFLDLSTLLTTVFSVSFTDEWVPKHFSKTVQSGDKFVWLTDAMWLPHGVEEHSLLVVSLEYGYDGMDLDL